MNATLGVPGCFLILGRIHHVTSGDRGEQDGVTHTSTHVCVPAGWEEVAQGWGGQKFINRCEAHLDIQVGAGLQSWEGG